MSRFTNGANEVHEVTRWSWERRLKPDSGPGGLPPGRRGVKSRPLLHLQPLPPSSCHQRAIEREKLPLTLQGQVQEEAPGSHEDICDQLERDLGRLSHYDTLVLSVCLRSLMSNHRPVDCGWGKCRKASTHTQPVTFLVEGKLWRLKGERKKLGKIQEETRWTSVVGLGALKKSSGKWKWEQDL